MGRLWFPVLLLAAVLALPLTAFAVLGDNPLQAQIETWLSQGLRPATVAGATVTLLTVDLLLPIPSSLVSTLAAHRLGFWGGMACSWLGMTLGAVAGFLAARWLGRVVAQRFSTPDDWNRACRLSRQYGPTILVVARAVPLLAEASVLYLGTTELGWRRFLTAVCLSNLGIAAAYSLLGHWASLPVALAASIGLPALVALGASLAARRNDRRNEAAAHDSGQSDR